MTFTDYIQLIALKFIDVLMLILVGAKYLVAIAMMIITVIILADIIRRMSALIIRKHFCNRKYLD